MKKLLFSTESKQEVSEFLLPYDGSALKKCARFTESITKIIQPSKYRIILFENLCNLLIMLDWKEVFGTDPDRNRVTWETPSSVAIPSYKSQ
jgi:hypothetical protein